LASQRRQLPPSIIASRLNTCRDRIQQAGVTGYLVTARPDQFYLTGFDGEDGAALILPRKVYLITDGRFEEEAARAAPWATAVVRTGTIPDALKPLMGRHRVARLGFAPEFLSVAAHAALRRTLRGTRLVPIAGLTDRLRLIKDPTEVAAIERAIRVAEGAFKSVIKRMRIGTTERALAAELEHEMKRRGASGASFPIIVAEGPNSSLPHATPGDRRIGRGSAVLIDWGATVNHYRSDLTRVIFVRRIPPRFRRMYEQVLAAQVEGIRAVRAGVRMCDADAAARKRLAAAGLAERFSHGLGHGIGLDIHEAPRLSRRCCDPLEPGMVVTVEPGVYFPGRGGVRIEDDVLVTRDRPRVLSRLTKDIESMVV
jgi:Xaa-Pro aminopeptidase